jgi:hypothetical protein
LIGDFKGNEYHGLGRYNFNSGTVMQGEFRNSQLVKGKISYNNSNSYEGELEDGQYHGTGIFIRFDKDFYQGQF